MLRIDWGLVRSKVRKPRTALRSGRPMGRRGTPRGRRGCAARSRPAPSRPRRPGGCVELEEEPDVEQAGDVFGTLEVAAHPEEVFGDPAEHFRSSRARSSGGSTRRRPRCAVVQDPGVLGAASLRAVDHQAPLRQGDPRQAARHDHDVFAIEHERAQVDVPAVEPAVDEGRVPAQADRGLGDVAARVGLDLAGELVALVRASTPGRSACRSRPRRRPP